MSNLPSPNAELGSRRAAHALVNHDAILGRYRKLGARSRRVSADTATAAPLKVTITGMKAKT